MGTLRPGGWGGGVGCVRYTATARSYILCEIDAAPVQTRAMRRRHSFLQDLWNLRYVSSQVTSGDGRFHNLGYFANLNQIHPLFSVETPRLKYSFTQLAVNIAAALPAERTWVPFPARARDLFFRTFRPFVGPPVQWVPGAL